MTIIRTMQKADAVLAIVDDLTVDGIKLYLLPYQNGREHGYALFSSGATSLVAAFSEYRNSDGIVVYTGNAEDFDIQGYTPNDKAWSRRKTFRFDAIYEAASYIVEFLKQE